MDDDDILRVAKAIADAGSPEHSLHAGPTLEELSKLAEEGELEAMSHSFIAHVALHADDRRTLLKYLPMKIHNRYFYLHRGCAHRAIEQWRGRSADWEERLRQAIADPPRFALVARTMADEIIRLEAQKKS